jgi:hypothetical protein
MICKDLNGSVQIDVSRWGCVKSLVVWNMN